MKMFKEFLKYVFSIVLALGVLVLIVCGVANNTVLKKEFIYSALRDTNYYQKVYDLVYDNFSIYVMQSGFDESVFNDIVTLDKVEKDTKIIFTNIYENKTDIVDTDEIKVKLRKNIDEFLENTGVKAEEKSLKKYENIISEQYKYSVNYHTAVIETLSKGLNTVNSIQAKVKVMAEIAIAVSLFMLIILNLSTPVVALNNLGVGSLFLGILSISLKLFINQFFNFDLLLVVNKALTNLLEFILNSIYSQLMLYGICFVIAGLFLIIVGSYMQAKKNTKVVEKK